MTNTTKFNGLRASQEERLVYLIEEASEVIKAATKILRHGLESQNPHHPEYPNSPTNQEDLETEIADFLVAVELLNRAGEVNTGYINEILTEKNQNQGVFKFMHHQDDI